MGAKIEPQRASRASAPPPTARGHPPTWSHLPFPSSSQNRHLLPCGPTSILGPNTECRGQVTGDTQLGSRPISLDEPPAPSKLISSPGASDRVRGL